MKFLFRRFGLPALMLLGAFIFFPELRKYEVYFDVDLASSGCPSEISLDVFRVTDRIRGMKERLKGQVRLGYEVGLAKGEYEVWTRLVCGAAGPRDAEPKMLTVEGRQDVFIRPSASCPCDRG